MSRQLPFQSVLGILALGVLIPWSGQRKLSQAQSQCVGIDGCSCIFDDGSGVIDVSSLGNTNNKARFEYVPANDGYLYSFNPCRPFSDGSCTNVAVCQINTEKTLFYSAGDANSASWSFDGVDVRVSYFSVSGFSFRESYVTFVCDQSADNPSELTVRSKCACKNGCRGGSSITVEVEYDGLTVGSIWLIVCAVLLVVYVTGGIVFNRTQRKASGLDMVPNISFWRVLPGYVKDGFVFTFSKLSRKRAGYDAA